VVTAVAVRLGSRRVEISVSKVAFRTDAAEIDATSPASHDDRRAPTRSGPCRRHYPHRRRLSGVMGLPLAETAQILARFGLPVL
jgi:hypothetical protein